MSLRKRLTTGAAALALAAGGVFAFPAAANAAETWASDGYATLSDCQFAESMARGVINGGGGTVFAGEECAYRGSVSQWGFSLVYE